MDNDTMETGSTTDSIYSVAMTNATSSSSKLRSSTSEATLVTTGYEISTTFMTDISALLTTTTSVASDGSSTLQAMHSTALYGNQTYINNVTSSNISEEEKYQYLEFLQEQTTMAMIPAMTYLIILAAIGLVGNSLVLFVYSKKFKQTSTRVFIMAIASFDIVTNIVCIPGEIYDMFHIWDFDQPMVCKTRLFFNAFTTMVAAMVLVAVAVVRYRKICKPFQKQVSLKIAKITSVTLAVTSLIFSIPYAIINGRQTKPTPRPGISGYECTIDDSYVNTIWPLVNGAFFIFLFIACSIPLVVMYIMIGVTAWKHSKVYGVVLYSKGKKEPQASDSGNSNEAGTKSTDDSPLKFTKTPKTRSFVKIKGKPSGELPSPSNQKECDNTVHGCDEHHQENHGKNLSCNTHNNEDDIDLIKYLDDTAINARPNTSASGKTTNSNNNNNINSSIRMIRTPTGEKVHINMSMVRELTVKLRAVKKEAESRAAEEDDSGNDSGNGESKEQVVASSEKLTEDANSSQRNAENDPLGRGEIDNSNKKDGERLFKHKIHRNKSAENNIFIETGKASASSYSKRFSKSVDDLSRLIERPGIVRELSKYKAAENEDLDLRADVRGLVDRQESNENETSEPVNDEPLSEFAKAMQWVDLTYCLQEDAKENENEANGDEPDANALSKKGSFALGRKISRDNSFLQRHRKLKDALTDTLTRARRSKREKEAAEAEAKENNGIATLENINSESENTCSNVDNNTAENGKQINDNSISLSRDNKTLKRKASKINDDLTSCESGNKVKVDRHRAKRRGIGRTTAMLILISAVYILGFLPYLGLMFAKSASPGTFESLDLASLALYNLFLRSYFLNSAANPIIYSLCDMNFRRECFSLLKCS